MANIRYFVFVYLLVEFVSLSLAEDPSGLFPKEDDPIPPSLVRKPRFIMIHSRAHPDAEPETGIGFSGHMKNVLKGGSLGFKFTKPEIYERFMKKLGRIFSSMKRSELKDENDGEGEKEWVDVKREKKMIEDGAFFINPRKNP